MRLMFEDFIAPVRDELLAAGVERLGVFGSVARGDAADSSDIDILVRFRAEARTLDNLVAVGEALERVFKRRVDLVTEDALSPYLEPHIRASVVYVDLAA
jgi:predicted nucleotidyltransferase